MDDRAVIGIGAVGNDGADKAVAGRRSERGPRALRDAEYADAVGRRVGAALEV
jgi:hypothetical protein